MSALPTLVLAHGAFSKASLYDSFAAQVEKHGMQVVTPQLPSSSPSPPAEPFAADVAVIHHALQNQLAAGDVVLLTHSYGGIPACEALKNLQKSKGRVRAIIFVSAFVADEGQNLITSKAHGHADWVRRGEGGLCYVNDPAVTLFSGISDHATVNAAVGGTCAQAGAALMAKATEATWKQYPCFYVKCLEDNANEVREQDHFIDRLRNGGALAGVEELSSCHYPFVSMPEDLAEMVKSITHSLATSASA